MTSLCNVVTQGSIVVTSTTVWEAYSDDMSPFLFSVSWFVTEFNKVADNRYIIPEYRLVHALSRIHAI